VGVNVTTARRWMRQAGGVIPQRMLQELSGRYLGPVDRAMIMVGREQGLSVRYGASGLRLVGGARVSV